MKFPKTVPSILLAASLALLAPVANAAGMIVVDPILAPPGGVPIIGRPVPTPRPTPRPGHPVLKGSVSFGLRLQAADIKVDINDQVAKTYITQTFVNDTDQQLAGMYLFPLPADTTFSSFSLHIDGKPVEGKILEANEARQQYEAIVRRLIDPGLLEYADYKTVRARIFPIPAHGTKKVELEYTQILKAENGLLKYQFPLKTETDTAPAEEVKVNVKLNSKQGLKTIWSPSHTITTDRADDHHAKIAYLGKDTIPDKDFFLYYSVSDKELAANVLTNKLSGEDGYFMLTLAPPVESKEVNAKDIVLVADTSGSMEGERMKQNKEALKYLVNALNPTDRFNIVHFDTDVESFKTNLVEATPENRKAALAYVEDLEARGGTNIGGALHTAASILDVQTDRPGYIVLMTDGEPTVGETSVPGLIKAINTKRDIRLFDFGVGYDINTNLLNKLATEHHGIAHYVEPDESIETSLSSFYQKIKSPVLSNVAITYDGVTTKDIYPREVKDIFAGSQVLLLGRYKNGADATIKLTGTINGVSKEFTFPLKFADADNSNSSLPRLWAMRRIGHLTDVAKENNENKEIIDEIVALSKKHGIISAYTSFLVTEPNAIDGHGNVVDFRRPGGPAVPMEEAVRGWGGAGAGGGFAERSAAVRSALPATRLDSMVTASGFDSAMVFGDEGTGAAPPAAGYYKAGAPAPRSFRRQASKSLEVQTGAGAVRREKKLNELRDAIAEETEKDKSGAVKTVGDKTFFLRADGFWVDSSYDEKTSPKVQEVTFGSSEYFELLKEAGINKVLAVGRKVIFVWKDKTYKITFKEEA